MNKVIYVSDNDEELKRLWRKLEKEAEKEGRSLSNYLNRRLEILEKQDLLIQGG